MAETTAPPAPTRTNEELNLTVLRRHNPSIVSIISLAPFAVVYLFNATTQQWAESSIRGTLFVCQLTQGELGEERYSVFILNRRGMENFEASLKDGDDVEITDEYVILKVEGDGSGKEGAMRGADGRESMVYGLWIFSEPPPSSTAETRRLNAQIIKEHATHAGKSKKFALERLSAERAARENEETNQLGSVQMNRQVSLQELMGQQRAQDDEWSVKVHSPALDPGHQFPLHAGTAQPEGNDVLGALFRKAGMGYQGQS